MAIISVAPTQPRPQIPLRIGKIYFAIFVTCCGVAFFIAWIYGVDAAILSLLAMAIVVGPLAMLPFLYGPALPPAKPVAAMTRVGNFQCAQAIYDRRKYLGAQKQGRDSWRALLWLIGFIGLFFPHIGWIISGILLPLLTISMVVLWARDPLRGIWNGHCPHCETQIQFHPPVPRATDIGFPCPICARQVIFKTGQFCRLID